MARRPILPVLGLNVGSCDVPLLPCQELGHEGGEVCAGLVGEVVVVADEVGVALGVVGGVPVEGSFQMTVMWEQSSATSARA